MDNAPSYTRSYLNISPQEYVMEKGLKCFDGTESTKIDLYGTRKREYFNAKIAILCKIVKKNKSQDVFI